VANGRLCQSLPRTAQCNAYLTWTILVPSSILFICSFVNSSVSNWMAVSNESESMKNKHSWPNLRGQPGIYLEELWKTS
jgi:hypothetical protein